MDGDIEIRMGDLAMVIQIGETPVVMKFRRV